jgi:hypothetical protein
MPTTRQGAETPHRNVQLQGPQKVDARKAAQSNKKDAQVSVKPKFLKTRQNINLPLLFE